MLIDSTKAKNTYIYLRGKVGLKVSIERVFRDLTKHIEQYHKDVGGGGTKAVSVDVESKMARQNTAINKLIELSKKLIELSKTFAKKKDLAEIKAYIEKRFVECKKESLAAVEGELERYIDSFERKMGEYIAKFEGGSSSGRKGLGAEISDDRERRDDGGKSDDVSDDVDFNIDELKEYLSTPSNGGEKNSKEISGRKDEDADSSSAL